MSIDICQNIDFGLFFEKRWDFLLTFQSFYGKMIGRLKRRVTWVGSIDRDGAILSGRYTLKLLEATSETSLRVKIKGVMQRPGLDPPSLPN